MSEVVFDEEDFGYGTKRVSHTSSPETLEVQPSSDDILKREEQAKQLQRRQSQCFRLPPVRHGIGEYVDPDVDSIQHHAYFACQIVESQTMELALEANSRC